MTYSSLSIHQKINAKHHATTFMGPLMPRVMNLIKMRISIWVWTPEKLIYRSKQWGKEPRNAGKPRLRRSIHTRATGTTS